jgi:hypothetical protein
MKRQLIEENLLPVSNHDDKEENEKMKNRKVEKEEEPHKSSIIEILDDAVTNPIDLAPPSLTLQSQLFSEEDQQHQQHPPSSLYIKCRQCFTKLLRSEPQKCVVCIEMFTSNCPKCQKTRPNTCQTCIYETCNTSEESSYDEEDDNGIEEDNDSTSSEWSYDSEEDDLVSNGNDSEESSYSTSSEEEEENSSNSEDEEEYECKSNDKE